MKRPLQWFAIQAKPFLSGQKPLYKWFDNEVNQLQVVCKQFASSSKTVHITLENIRLDYIRF